jgi:phosphatidylserine/phosphatidylglycerophosphate/cardiolipin synthase-like enzyme
MNIKYMAKFLDTLGISNELGQIIKNAKEKLVIVSPYLQISERFKEMLEDQDRMRIYIDLIYRKSELQPTESNWLKGLTSVRTRICKNLHAKCYLNESRALITSMNFYEFSQVNNEEMGIVVSKDEDPQLYDDISKEIQRLIRNNDEIKVTVEKVTPNKKNAKFNKMSSKSGHCMRCGIDIKLDPKIPLCKKCYKSWNKFADPTYQEKFCHICGEEFKSSMEKPACLNCYNKNKSLF